MYEDVAQVAKRRGRRGNDQVRTRLTPMMKIRIEGRKTQSPGVFFGPSAKLGLMV